MVVKETDFKKIAKIIVIKLYKNEKGFFGKGSLYLDNLKKGTKHEGGVKKVAEVLYRKQILGRKKKKRGYKYYILDKKWARKIRDEELTKEEWKTIFIIFSKF